ncbi:MAG: toll/interleukin-1 receptor domain-containing protein [Pseudomonadota bacterium]
MRVYLIAAPEDEAEAEKLAEYLKRYGVFIRAEYGRMSYPPAHTGEYTLALWSRNAMMSSRQMMLTNRAIDAWENGQLVMARLEHGLNPRGLGDLEMVDLTFAAARQHRYHDVLNALRAMEDERRAFLREQAEAEREGAAMSLPTAGAADIAMSAPMESAADMAPPAPSAKRRAGNAPAPKAAPAPAKSRGFSGLWLGGLALIVVGGGVAFWLSGGTDAAFEEPVVRSAIEEPIPEPPVAAETDPSDASVRIGELDPEMPVTREGTPQRTDGTTRVGVTQAPTSLPRVRNEIASVEGALRSERRTLARLEAASETPEETLTRQRELIARLDRDLIDLQRVEVELRDRTEASTPTPPPAEPGLLDRLRQYNGPVAWAVIAGLVGLILLLFLFGRRKRPVSDAPSIEAEPEEPEAPVAPDEPVAPSAPILDGGHDAFVSYSHANAETVLPIVQSIEADGITVWIDRDEMRAGQNWAGQIVRAIKSADRFCLMCSAQAFESDHVRREVYLADKYGKKMVPIRLDATEMPEDIEYFLIGRQWIDLFEVAEEDRMKAIKTLLSESDN